MGNASLQLFIVRPSFYMSRIYKDLSGIYQFEFVAFLQYMGKYLLKEVRILKRRV